LAVAVFAAAWLGSSAAPQTADTAGRTTTSQSAVGRLLSGRGDSANSAQSLPGSRPVGNAVPDSSVPTAPGDAKYTIVLTSDTTGTSWTGTQKIDFDNPGRVPITEFWIRTWADGYTGCSSTLAEQVTAMTGGRIAESTASCTALRVVLDQPLKAGAHGSIAFDLAITVPQRHDRFGSFDGQTFLGNAIPLLAVKDERGWSLSPYVAFGESFYSAVADFDVTLTHPSSLVTPSAGQVAGETTAGNQTVTHILAPKVRDFVWSIGTWDHASVTSSEGVVLDGYWPSAESDSANKRLLQEAAEALDAYSDRYGTYPYPHYTVVFDDFGNAFSGMEYPTYVLSLPDAGTIVHETAHQWWYALVGDDAYSYPWIKESLAEYSAEEFQGLISPAHSCGFPDGNIRLDQTMATYEPLGDYEYHDVIYHEGTCMWFDLEERIGRPAMDKFLRTVFQKFEYGNVRPSDIRAAAQSATGDDLTSFWQRWRDTGP
jgi:hypothetical protein